MAMDLQIDLLRLSIRSASGHEHRIAPIALRAATLLAERVKEFGAGGARLPQASDLEVVATPAVSLDLNRTSDAEVAGRIADTWLEAILLHLEA